jgi:hypothetical protein
MAKILLNISERQQRELKKRAKDCGVTVSEYIRRIFDLVLYEAEISSNSAVVRSFKSCPLVNPKKEPKNG